MVRDEKGLADVITRREPLGPPYSEALVNTSPEIFRQLYDATNHIHRSTRHENPSYIVGRKGSGKTAFLIGGAIVENADVVALKSENIYTDVERLRISLGGTVVADSLVHVWEVLLFHAAMWGLAKSEHIPDSHAKREVWNYMSSFGDPMRLEEDELIARVTGFMTESLVSPDSRLLSFRERCWNIEPGRGSLKEASRQTRAIMAERGEDGLYVVVDNLEDLHNHLGAFEHIITGLFRIVSKDVVASRSERLPFRTRFAFPSELLGRLRVLAANPEKDFRNRLIVSWNASELIVIAGNRLRTFLDLYWPNAWERLQLPRRHDPKDRDAAERTLRAVLPSGPVFNGFGQAEDPVGYIMRHTQLLPRHVIQILNEIVSRSFGDERANGLPTVTPADVKAGVHEAEHVIVEGILSTYQHEYPRLGEALAHIKNHAAVVQPTSQLHNAFNHAGAKRAGIEFDEFLDACLSVGALGLVTNNDPTARYVQGTFSYTFADGGVRPTESRDSVCVHPLFMYRWFDAPVIRRMKEQNVRAVYPYGSDPEDDFAD